MECVSQKYSRFWTASCLRKAFGSEGSGDLGTCINFSFTLLAIFRKYISHSLIIFLLEHVISGVRAQMEQELESARLRQSALQMQIEVSKAELDAVKSKLKQQEDAIIEEQHRYDAVLADKTKEIQLEFYQLEQEAARHPVSCSHLPLVFEAIHFLFCPKKNCPPWESIAFGKCVDLCKSQAILPLRRLSKNYWISFFLKLCPVKFCGIGNICYLHLNLTKKKIIK